MSKPLIFTGDYAQAEYWSGSISRAEVQKIFDEYGAAISAQAAAISKLDLCLGYLCEKFGITPEDISKWAAEKAIAMQQGQAKPN